MATDLTDRLAEILARIIDDPIVVKILLERDPQAWADAVSVLAEAEGYEPEPHVGLTGPGSDPIPATWGGPFTADD